MQLFLQIPYSAHLIWIGILMNRAGAAVVLGVSTSTSRDEPRAAYRAQVRILHPDRFGTEGLTEQATASAALQRVIPSARCAARTAKPSAHLCTLRFDVCHDQ